MTLEALREHWETLGRSDPLWAVLTEPGREGGGWDVGEFLATGRDEVARHLAALDQVGVDPPRGRALDFGCGAGRLTQALAEHFDQVDGVDIAASMVDEARRINRQGDRCRFHVNAASDLSMFGDESFDFVLSMIVLQHMEPRFALAYIREFVRVLAPGGIALFQVPAATSGPVVRPLPRDAWLAELAVEGAPGRLRAGEPVDLNVRIRNASPVDWPADAGLGVGAHWRSEGGALVKIGDGRAALPRALAPGDEVTLPLTVMPPNAPGRLILEVDAVQERVDWFRDRGSEPFRTPVEIGGDGEPLARAAEPEVEPWIAMYVIPRAEVQAFVESAGGEVAHALPDISAGDAFESYLYVVRRSPVATTRAALDRLRHAMAAVPGHVGILPPVTTTRTGSAARAELAIKRRIARLTKWFTIAQVEHDRAVVAALEEIEAALVVQDAELRALRAELERRPSDS